MSRRALALVCAVVGLAASAHAAYVHYHLLHDPHYTSFCDVNATVSCTKVYMSRYSTVRGVPVAIFGAIWFAVRAAAVARRPARAARRCGRACRATCSSLSTLGAGGDPLSRVRVVRS